MQFYGIISMLYKECIIEISIRQLLNNNKSYCILYVYLYTLADDKNHTKITDCSVYKDNKVICYKDRFQPSLVIPLLGGNAISVR